MAGPLIEVQDLKKVFKLPHEKQSSLKSSLINFRTKKRTYETQIALNGISFQVEPGEFFGIVGRNGSGKSTLLKILAGIYQADTGKIFVNGRLSTFIELGVGFNPDLAARDNVLLNATRSGLKPT